MEILEYKKQVFVGIFVSLSMQSIKETIKDNSLFSGEDTLPSTIHEILTPILTIRTDEMSSLPPEEYIGVVKIKKLSLVRLAKIILGETGNMLRCSIDT